MERTELFWSLAAPLDPSTIAWRQDGKPVNRDGRIIARFVCYVEASTVRERLDSLVPGEWDLTLTPLPLLGSEPGEQTVSIKARLQVAGVAREGVGTGPDYKQAATDAFKRAAVLFGIGHELYQMEQLWCELDGDGKYAKPLEDPAVVYARRFGGQSAGGATPIQGGESASGQSSEGGMTRAPAESGTRALDEETCPKCGGRMYDNRLTKRNPRAPDFKCQDRSCGGVIWPAKAYAVPNRANYNSEPKESTWVEPLPGAPLIPDNSDLPF